MACKAIVIIFLTASLLGICLGQGCPTSEADIASWANEESADCMRVAVRALRLSKDNCRNVMDTLKDCINGSNDACSADQTAELVTTISSFMEILGDAIVTIYTPIFCDNDFSILPNFGDVPDVDIPGCSANYLSKLVKCSETALTIFQADPLDPRMCEENNNVAKCQVDTSRELCTIFTEEQLKEIEDAARDGNFFCTDASPAVSSLQASMLASHVISLLYVVFIVWWQ